MTPLEVARQFVNQINTHNLEGIVELMTHDHRFIDSLGTAFVGSDVMREGWRQYFQMVPDYQIEVEKTFCEGTDVVLVGLARGTYSRGGEVLAETDAWEIPAAWRALIDGDRVAEWQVYADNEPIRRRMTVTT